MSNSKANTNPTKVRIPCRISFANIYEPKSINGSDPKYSVSCLIDKKDTATLDCIKKAIEVAKEKGLEKYWSGKLPAKFKWPLHDGDVDRPDDEAYAGCYFVNATSKDKPQVVDRKVQPIEDPMMVYSGCNCNVTVNFYPYNSPMNKGITAGLGNIQFVSDGDRLAGRASAKSDFDVLESEAESDFDELPDYLR